MLKPKTLLPALLAGLLLFSGMALLGGCAATESTINRQNEAVLSDVVTDERLSADDFDFPPAPLSLKQGKAIFETNCVKCHAAGTWQGQKTKEDLAYTTPIDLYLFLSTGKAPEVEMPTAERKRVLPTSHPGGSFKQLDRADRWAAILYVRYLAGAGDTAELVNAQKKIDVATVFGGNCAVCHGTRGQADGFLHTGKTGNHALRNAELHNDLVPAPANFRDFRRVFNRTDAQLFKYICQGIYPSAMPSWYGNVDRDSKSGDVNYVFDDKLIMNLVRHIRGFTVDNDLKDANGDTPKPPPGLARLQNCPPAATNRPWTPEMQQNAPGGFQAVPLPREINDKDPYHGMTFESRNHQGQTLHESSRDNEMESRR